MKKISFIAVLLLAISLVFCLAACDNKPVGPGEDPNKNPDSGLLQGELIMVSPTATVTLGDVYTPKVMIGEEVLSCSWSSSNESVATVSGNGKITAHNLGEATVTATYGDRSIDCKITVVLNDNLPVLKLDNIDGDSAQIDRIHALSLAGKVLFNGNEYTDISLEYSLEDDSFGTITNGIFNPSKLGETSITVTASWRGIASDFLTKTVNVKIIESVIVLLNDSSELPDIDLYTVDDFAGVSYAASKPFDAKIVIAGEQHNADVIISDTGIVRFDEAAKQLVAVGAGKTSVTISYNQGPISINQSVTVNVTSPIANYDKKIVGFSALDGDLVDEDGNNVLASIFSGNNALYYATQGNNYLDVSTGKVLGVETSHEGLTKTTITVVGKQYGYTFDVEGYTKVIDEAKDFNVFDFTKSGTVLRGYFIVTKDIDFLKDSTGFNLFCNTTGWDNALSSSWFAGIFDGNGHTVNGYPMTKNNQGTNSMFGRVEGGVIKNVAFTNVQTLGDGCRLFAQRMGLSIDATVSNVYISFEIGSMDNPLFARDRDLSVFGDGEHNLILDSVIVELNASSNVLVSYDNGVGFFRKDANGKTATYKDVYLVAPPADNGRILPVLQTKSLSIYAKNDFDAFGIKDLSKVYFNENGDCNPILDDLNLNPHRITFCNVMRYNTLADLANTGVTSVGNWDITSGKPVWTGISEN